MKKTIALLLALIMLFAMFAACGKKDDTGSNDSQNSGTTQKPNDSGTSAITGETKTSLDADKVHPSDKTLKVAQVTDATGVSYVGNRFDGSYYRALEFYESLYMWDSTSNTAVPCLATSYEWIDDLTLRFHLRDDVTSILGDPMTASDVIFTFNWNNEVGTLNSYYNLFDYEKTKAVDDYTVDIVLLEPYPFLTTEICHPAYNIAVEASVEKIGKDNVLNNPCAGTGPYKPLDSENIPGVMYKSERRDDYWGTPPYYKYIENWVVVDGTTRTMGVEAGDYDIAVTPPTSTVVAAKDTKGVTGWSIPTLSVMQFRLNSDTEPLNVKECRQAIGLAINYDSMVQIACSGLGYSTDSLFNPNSDVYCAPVDGAENCVRYDPEAAKQKLVEAGYPNGFTIDCTYRNTAVAGAYGELLKNQLGQVGITLELVPMEAAAANPLLRAGDFATTLSGPGNPSTKRLIQSVDPRSSHDSTNGCSGSQWAPEGFAELVDKCLTTVDPDESTKLFTELQTIVREYVPHINLACPDALVYTSDKITGLGLNYTGGLNPMLSYEADYIG